MVSKALAVPGEPVFVAFIDSLFEWASSPAGDRLSEGELDASANLSNAAVARRTLGIGRWQ
jgi:hypothetical protein